MSGPDCVKGTLTTCASSFSTSAVLSNCTPPSLAKTVDRLQAATLISTNRLMKSFTSGWINGFPGMLIFSGSLPGPVWPMYRFSGCSSVLYSGIEGWHRAALRQWVNCSCCNRFSVCWWKYRTCCACVTAGCGTCPCCHRHTRRHRRIFFRICLIICLRVGN